MKLIASGATADIFLNNDNTLVKLFKAGYSKETVQIEANNQRIVFEKSIPTPEVYDLIEFNGRHGIVMEHIKGISLGEKFLKSNNYLNGVTVNRDSIKISEEIIYYFSLIIDLQMKVNSIRLETYPLMKNKLARDINAANYLDYSKKKTLLDKLEKLEFKNNLCHGDFRLYNLIETENGIKIIDWADSTIGNMEADIYRSYFIYWIHHPEIGNEYLKMYCSKANLEKEKILEYEPILMAARLSENVSDWERDKIVRALSNKPSNFP